MSNDEKPTSVAISSGSIATAQMRGELTLTRAVGESLCAPPDDHPIYAKVGKVASDWAHVEHMLDLIISELAATNLQIVVCITAQMTGVYPRCKAILALLNLVQQKRQTDLNNLIS
jgi:hypothetical protein